MSVSVLYLHSSLSDYSAPCPSGEEVIAEEIIATRREKNWGEIKEEAHKTGRDKVELDNLWNNKILKHFLFPF